MSGGSYDYLFSKDAETLVTDSVSREELKHMAARLEDFGEQATAARSLTLSIHEDLETLRTQFDAQLAAIDRKKLALGEVWRSIEWCDSLDSTEKAVRQSLEAFNAQNPAV